MSLKPTQPQFVEPPVVDRRRSKYMAALSLAENLIACAELPTDIRIECASWDVEARVVAYAHHDIGLLHAWQARFGGDIHHELTDEATRVLVYSSLTGRAFDAPFKLVTLRYMAHSPEEDAAERELCARWVAEHGDPTCEWAPETHAAYLAAIEALRVAVAA